MKRALLVIDVQNEYFAGKMKITYPDGSFNNILKAIDAANKNDIPVILIRHGALQQEADVFATGSKGWNIHEDVLRKRHVCIIDKNLPGSFTGTNLEECLKKMEITTVVICGYMTQMCCDTTARQAVHLGYSVEFLSDGTGTLDVSNSAGTIKAKELHQAILITQQMRFSKVISVNEWIQERSIK